MKDFSFMKTTNGNYVRLGDNKNIPASLSCGEHFHKGSE